VNPIAPEVLAYYAGGPEGPGWLIPDLAARWTEPAFRERLLWAARAVEREPALIGVSPHLLAVGRKPAGVDAERGAEHP
jgi:hypothetical protein